MKIFPKKVISQKLSQKTKSFTQFDVCIIRNVESDYPANILEIDIHLNEAIQSQILNHSIFEGRFFSTGIIQMRQQPFFLLFWAPHTFHFIFLCRYQFCSHQLPLTNNEGFNLTFKKFLRSYKTAKLITMYIFH